VQVSNVNDSTVINPWGLNYDRFELVNWLAQQGPMVQSKFNDFNLSHYEKWHYDDRIALERLQLKDSGGAMFEANTYEDQAKARAHKELVKSVLGEKSFVDAAAHSLPDGVMLLPAARGAQATATGTKQAWNWLGKDGQIGAFVGGATNTLAAWWNDADDFTFSEAMLSFKSGFAISGKVGGYSGAIGGANVTEALNQVDKYIINGEKYSKTDSIKGFAFSTVIAGGSQYISDAIFEPSKTWFSSIISNSESMLLSYTKEGTLLSNIASKTVDAGLKLIKSSSQNIDDITKATIGVGTSVTGTGVGTVINSPPPVQDSLELKVWKSTHWYPSYRWKM
jgi:hypothetical protein